MVSATGGDLTMSVHPNQNQPFSNRSDTLPPRRASASLVAGILSPARCSFLTAIPAIIRQHVGIKQADRGGEWPCQASASDRFRWRFQFLVAAFISFSVIVCSASLGVAGSGFSASADIPQRVTCIGLHYASDAQMLILRGANALDSERIGHLDSLGTGPF